MKRLSEACLVVSKRFFKIFVVGILLVLAFPKSIFAAEEPTAFCTMTIRSDIHTESNPAHADGVCNGDFLEGFYIPYLDEFALRGYLTFNLKANPDGQVFTVAIPQTVGHILAEVTVYTIKINPPKEEPKNPPKDENPTNPPKQENPTNPPKQENPKEEPKQPPKDEKPKTEQPKTEQPKTEQPKTEQPKTEQPKTQHPTTQQPKTEQPKNQQPKTNTVGQNTGNEQPVTESKDRQDETNTAAGTDEKESNDNEKKLENNENEDKELEENSSTPNKDKDQDQDQDKDKNNDIELSRDPEINVKGVSEKRSSWLWMGALGILAITAIIAGYWWYRKKAFK